MGHEAAEWLIDEGVKVVGIDQWSWDRPLKFMAAEAKKRQDPAYFWEGHRVGIRKECLYVNS